MGDGSVPRNCRACRGGRLLESGILPRVALYIAAQLACALLAAYALVRCDRRATRLALVLCLCGFFLVMLAHTLRIVAFTATQVILYRTLAVSGGALAALGGAGFTVHLARRQIPARRGWTSFLAAIAAGVTVQAVLHLDAVDRVVPAASALAVLALVVWLFARRRLLFPNLDRMVLDASVPESRGGIVVFGTDGRYIDSGSAGSAASFALDGGGTIGGFVARVRELLVAGRFYTPSEIEDLGADEPGREIELGVPGATAHYLVFANPVREAQGPRLGVVFGFYDISRQKRIEREIEASNADLDATYGQLRGYLAVAGALEEERERRSVADEVHRTLGRKIAGLLAAARGGPGAPPAGLEELLAGCRGVMGEIRSTVDRLVPDRGRGDGPS